VKRFMKSVNWPKPGYASITCSTVSNIPYNLIFTTKFNDSSILITIISCDFWICHWRMNTLVTSQYQLRLSSITKIFSRRISQSDWNIQIKLNYKYLTITSVEIKMVLCSEMVSVLASIVVDRGFEPRPGKTTLYNICICCFSVNHAALYMITNVNGTGKRYRYCLYF
jgi:hypothetical protein